MLIRTSLFSLTIMTLLLGACAATPPTAGEASRPGAGLFRTPDDGPGHQHLVEAAREQVPRELPRSRYGNPKVYEVFGKFYQTLDSASGYSEQGNASWYGAKFHGRLTSSREVYDMYQLTAAHRSLPIPTFVEVTNLDNGRSIIAKVNDRGPFHDDRIIDLSYAAAVKLDMIKHGTAPVEVRAIDPAEPVNQTGSVQTAAVATDNAVAGQPPVTTVEAMEEPASTVSREGIYVQLGAFSLIGNAETMRARIRQIVPAASVNILPSAGRELFHVQLGPLHSEDLLGDVLADLNRAGVTSYHLLSY